MEGAWEILKGLVVIGRRVDRFVYRARIPREVRVLLLQLQELREEGCDWEFSDAKKHYLMLVVFVPRSYLAVQVFAVKLRCAIADHIILYLLLQVPRPFRFDHQIIINNQKHFLNTINSLLSD